MAELEKIDTKQAIVEAVESYFERDGVKYTPFDERGTARANYGIKSKVGHVTVFFSAQKDKLLLRSVLPVNASEAERPKVAEYLMRANYGLKIGGFDFDFDDGEISYRVAMYFGDEEFAPPTYEQIDYALVVSLMMIDKYGNSLLKVLFGLVEPEDAIEEAEAKD